MPDPRNPYCSQKDCFVKFWKKCEFITPSSSACVYFVNFRNEKGKVFPSKTLIPAGQEERVRQNAPWSRISFLGSWQDKSSQPDSLTWRSLSRLSRVLSSSSYPGGVSKSRKYQKTRGKHSLLSSSQHGPFILGTQCLFISLLFQAKKSYCAKSSRLTVDCILLQYACSIQSIFSTWRYFLLIVIIVV